MYEQVEKAKENKSRAVADCTEQRKSDVEQGFGFVDNRPKSRSVKSLRVVQRPNPFIIIQRSIGTDQLKTYVKEESSNTVYYAIWNNKYLAYDLQGVDDKGIPTGYVVQVNPDDDDYSVISESEAHDLLSSMSKQEHSEWRFDKFSEYRDWDVKTSGVEIDAPFGSGKVSAYHNRGAPKISSKQSDFGGAKLGDSYAEYKRGLQSGGLTDSQIALALLDINDSALGSDLEKRAGAMLHITVYLAEEWRKQGAAKIYRAMLRLIIKGTKTFDDFIEGFKYISSADNGRKMVARINDVFKGGAEPEDLPFFEEEIYEAMSPIREDDLSSDEEMRDESHKKLKSKSRLHAKHHESEKGWQDPWL